MIEIEEKDNGKKKFNFGKIDYILMGVLIAVYSVITFINLGSVKVPNSFWWPAQTGESIKVDFGEIKSLDSLSSYLGLEGKYQISFSKDNAIWEDRAAIENNYANVFSWHNTSINIQARYAKITVEKPNGTLSELAFYEKNNNKPLEIKQIIPENISQNDEGSYQNLFDEQIYAEKNSSYKTGTYFDEVYHARAAFEHLNKVNVFETTHPPLGKDIISAGVAIFGMNPFGWRVAGTLFGIFMIPLIYLFAKKLFKKTEYAFLATFILTFDFMHFTQSRISTIDIYAVFFIMAMYYFMYMYIESNIYTDGLKKPLIYLLLCGISTGLGIATKWIGFYSAAGLAVIFFIDFYNKFKEYKYAQKYVSFSAKNRDADKTSYYKNVIKAFVKNNVIIFLSCIITFIIIPLIIYVLSYIPFLMVKGANHNLGDIFNAQMGMYDYHSKLVAEHPYSSSWWQWPFVDKSLFFYTGIAGEGKVSQIWLMGNPAVWWIGLICAFATMIIGVLKKDKVALFLIIGGLSQFVPWMLVTRLTFLYHYFATLIFVMLCIVYIWVYLREKKPKHEYFVYGFLAVSALLFTMLYPDFGTVLLALLWLGTLWILCTWAFSNANSQYFVYGFLAITALLFLSFNKNITILVYLIAILVLFTLVFIWALFKGKYQNIIYGYMAIVLILFIMFYPIMSAMEISNNYVQNYLNWLMQ